MVTAMESRYVSHAAVQSPGVWENLQHHTTTTVTISVHPFSLRFAAAETGIEGSPRPPASQPKSAKSVASTSTPKMAPTSCHDGRVLKPLVTKINQFSVSEISRKRIPCMLPKFW